ncbi:MAG: hypothetical protein A2015_16325 [Spirochaetes bacterium GWF1_31_7]|nr:MAG: hypothetical protein A2Y30_13695 [Spirochaetes bacterium GWE1_32_154]OHD50016.1 MAG: hypothetical protein A2Y29_11740 [Spirochaetes bacterium GWE2_31_10]OHD52331.1 MAG: hypothetical protein A2015_16325 [Spirochaetes bacterium GWF1_31_7]HBI38481.1 hypothetical protein [Spirochaetia bacterium]
MENLFLNNKEKITSLSFFNNNINNLLSNLKIDFYRLDIFEISNLFGKNDIKQIKPEDFIFIAKNFNNSIPLFIDIPISLLYSDTISDLINFYNETNATGLSIDIKYSETNIVKQLKFENIPVIGYSNNSNIKFDKIKDYSLEFQSQGGNAIIFENFNDSIIESLKSFLMISVISDNFCKNDGIYGKISDIIGLSDKNKRMLNFNELFIETIKDFNFQCKKK